MARTLLIRLNGIFCKKHIRTYSRSEERQLHIKKQGQTVPETIFLPTKLSQFTKIYSTFSFYPKYGFGTRDPGVRKLSDPQHCLEPVFRICNILIRIRILGSVHFITDPDLFGSGMAIKNEYFYKIFLLRYSYCSIPHPDFYSSGTWTSFMKAYNICSSSNSWVRKRS
jgi:hypothetical protein